MACFLCHSNGPRAIRPNYDSQEASIGFQNKIRVAIWNLGIKLNGRIEKSPLEKFKDGTSRLGHNPFRFRGHEENQKLEAKTCVHCHQDSGFLARGTLTRQNFMAIRFMVESGAMPPPGFSLSQEERKNILEFAGASD